MKITRITVDSNQMNGVPCVRGLRIPVATVVEMVAQGMSDTAILTPYPDLELGDIGEARSFDVAALRERELPIVGVA